MPTATDLIDYVPTDGAADNLAWRIAIGEAAARDRHVQRALYSAAMDDLLFFLAAFCWLMEPRGQVKTIPFIPWVHQKPVFLLMDQTITDAEKGDVPVALTLPKSRAQGATYGYIYVLMRRFLRDRDFSAGVVTRNEALVDSRTDKDTILWKIWWGLNQLPTWMLPPGLNEKEHRSLSDHTILNPENGSLFTGYSATGDVSRGGRHTVFVLDEFGSEEFSAGGKDYRVLSSISHVTKCIFLVSTFGGETGAFYEAATEPDNPRLITLDWKDNPDQTRSAYVMREGVLVAVDPDDQGAVNSYSKSRAAQLKKLERRGHQMEGKFRSPWYDAYCLLPGATPRFIARELDMDARGATGKIFAMDVLDEMKAKCCRLPDWEGRPVFNTETLDLKGLIKQPNGPLKLWFRPGLDNSPPQGRFAVGADIAAGTQGVGASNSVASGANLWSGEQVMEYVVRGMPPTKFARNVVGLCLWLRKAYLGWEITGPTGAKFGEEVMEGQYYGNVYYRDVAQLGSRAKSRHPGWANFKDEDKGKLFDDLGLAMEEGSFIPRSAEMIQECGEWEWDSKGKIVHKPTQRAGIAPASHGDRCVAGGVLNLLLMDRRRTVGIDKSPESVEGEPPYGCLAWRIGQEKLRKQALDDGSGDDQGDSRQFLALGPTGE